MPNVYFLTFELIIYLQFVICLQHAWKKGTANVLRLVAGVLYGVSLELATIRQVHAYNYGQFVIMILDVPLCIGVAWSCILYSSMEFSNASSVPYWARPIVDGVLALNIDLALDAVAIRLGFWDWGQGLRFEYFGVPYGNFWAWFWVVFFFSLGYRLLARRKDVFATYLAPVLALIMGLFGVLGTNALIAFVVRPEQRTPIIFVTLAISLVCLLFLRPRFNQRPVPALVFWVPFLTHVYILMAGLISTTILTPPFLLLMGLAMTALALYWHRPTLQTLFNKRSVS